MPPPDNITVGTDAVQSWASFRITFDGVELPASSADFTYRVAPESTELLTALPEPVRGPTCWQILMQDDEAA